MKAFRIRMVGKQDINQEDYYFTTTHVPCFVDLNRAVIHFYPDEEEDGSGFGGELVIRHYDPKAKATASAKFARRRRTRHKASESPGGVVVEEAESEE